MICFFFVLWCELAEIPTRIRAVVVDGRVHGRNENVKTHETAETELAFGGDDNILDMYLYTP